MSPIFRDIALLGAVSCTFAALITAHVALVAGLMGRPPRWRALIALLVPPLAPYFGYGQGLRRKSTLWLVTAGLYLAMLALALWYR